ncbi:MAG: CBS domain-containing protein [Aggregatilineales bacterium]
MHQEPIIFLVSHPGQGTGSLEEILRHRYVEGYRIVVTFPDSDPLSDPLSILHHYREQGEQIALIIYELRGESDEQGIAFLDDTKNLYPHSRRLLLTDAPDPKAAIQAVNRTIIDYYLVTPWDPAEIKLYPALDELLADWRASVDMPFMHVKGIMTVRAVRIRTDDTLHRAAEIIALSGMGDLMVIDDDNNFIGVLSVGDVLRAAMPDIDEIMEEGGTLEQAFRLFLRKGSELMYQPIAPLIITNPLVVEPDDHVAKVAALMLQKNIHRLPVVKDNRLIGTVGRADICLAVVGTL